ELKMIAVAEPDNFRRNRFRDEQQLTEEHTFSSREDLLDLGKIADIAIICTQDREHFKPTIQALELGYDVLLEKPMSPDPLECIEMEKVARENDCLLTICHGLRYTSFWTTIRDIIAKGTIGDVASIQLNEMLEVCKCHKILVEVNWNNRENPSQ